MINAADSNLDGLWKRALNAVKFAVLSTWLVVSEKYDVVITSSGPITVGFAGIMAKWFRRSRFVFEVRDLWPGGAVQLGLIKGFFKQKIAFYFESICYRYADIIVALSLGMQRDIVDRFPHVKTCVVTNMSDAEFFKYNPQLQMALPDNLMGKKLLVYFGSLGLMDACEEVVDAMLLLRHRNDIAVVFIGDGAFKNDIEERVAFLGLQNQFHFTGLLPKKDLRSWLQHAVASLVLFKSHPVLSTVSPNKMFDSFAAGLPIIHNTHGWIKDLVHDTGCGLSVEPLNASMLAAAFERIVDDLEFRKLSARAALLLGQSSFDAAGRSLLFYNTIKEIVK